MVEEFKIGGVEAKLRAIQEEVTKASDTASKAREVAEELAVERAIPSEFDALLVAEFSSKPPPKAQINTNPNTIDPFQKTQPSGPESPKETPSVGHNSPDFDYPLIAEPPLEQTSPPISNPLGELNEIAKQYALVRKTMNSGSLRTARMTSIFAQMQATARRLGGITRGY